MRPNAAQCKLLKTTCDEMNLPISSARVERFLSAAEATELRDITDVRIAIDDIQGRVWDELNARIFLALRSEDQRFYTDPLRDWGHVIARFPSISDDAEEASMCYALERYGGCIFHLMRVTEAIVVQIGKLVENEDYKPQFGSVLGKIDRLIHETRWQDWPERAKAHKQFFVDVLPALYAVKTSWRDKALHFNEHIVPTEAISNQERARDIYNSTLSLGRMIAERLPGLIFRYNLTI